MICDDIETKLTEHGAQALKDDRDAQAHVADCPRCFGFLEALGSVDRELRALAIEDAPDAIVAKTLAAIGEKKEITAPRQPIRRAFWRRHLVAISSAAAAVLAVMSVSFLSLTRFEARAPQEPVMVLDLPAVPPQPSPSTPPPAELSYYRADPKKAPRQNKAPEGGGFDDRLAKADPPPANRPRGQVSVDVLSNPPAPVVVNDQPVNERGGDKGTEYDGRVGKKEAIVVAKPEPARDGATAGLGLRGAGPGGGGQGDAFGGDKNLAEATPEKPDEHQTQRRLETKADLPYTVTPKDALKLEEKKRGQEQAEPHGLLDMRKLVFKDPKGYWANTYVPGDPAMRMLAVQLAQTNKNGFYGLSQLRLDGDARRIAQPFDAPENSALAVYLTADRKSAQGETRMIVQVGIKGSERHSRARPPMNAAFVLDLRTAPNDDAKTAIKALIEALGKARDTGDKFSLVVAGAPGALVVPPESFKHGPLTVAMQQLLDGVGQPTGQTLTLKEATETAIAQVLGSDDATTPLGTSTVMLITPSPIGQELVAIEGMAHAAAVSGVPVSAVGIGSDARIDELDTIALAGQGNRRVLGAAADARNLVDRELTAVSGIVARALRLRIRLAPGVKLVDVLGSYRLDEVRAEQVRQAEQSIDKRISKNLGIEADRGEDEEGIQIVIPSFYAGDTHVVLLDVVAPGPGPLADVRVRYKDLVYLKNGVSRATLAAERTQAGPGPLEVNVTKNVLAYAVSRALVQAGEALERGDVSTAQTTLAQMSQVLAGRRATVPTLALDRDVDADLRLLGEYRTAVQQAAHDPSASRYVARSLKYSGFVKLRGR